MLLSVQQKYYLETVRAFKCLRLDQLHTLLREKFRRPGVADVNEGHMAAMLRQLRRGNWDIRTADGLVWIAGAKPDPRRLEAIDVMLELTEGAPQDLQAELPPPFILRFTLGGEKLRLFAVAALDPGLLPACVERRRMERIVWISDSGTAPEGLVLPPKHFFAARQPDGSHRFYGSNGP